MADSPVISREEWERRVDGFVAYENAKIGKLVLGATDDMEAFPQNNFEITKDVIRRFCRASGIVNPLYTDEEYAKKTRWGGIVAPPGRFLAYIAQTGSFANEQAIPGMNRMYGGTEYIYYGDHVRPGDTYRIEDYYLGAEEKKVTGKPYRLFTVSCKRSYINQDNKTICDAIGNIIITAAYPEKDDTGHRKALMEFPKRRRYTDEELDAIHACYEDELAGKFCRGAEILYWDDVNVGDKLPTLLKGPLDLTDSIGFCLATGFNFGAYATKWQGIRGEKRFRDPETNEWVCGVNWHFVDELARQDGLPYAMSFGAGNEITLFQPALYWMGDDAYVKKAVARHRRMNFVGDSCTTYGVVDKKYVDADGDYVVEVKLWNENQYGVKYTEGHMIIRLVKR